ncbi:MAG: methyl-accepting chemotaxis protein [Chroococcales cyanobacterium]
MENHENATGKILAQFLSLIIIGIQPVLGWVIFLSCQSEFKETAIVIFAIAAFNVISFGVLSWWNRQIQQGMEDQHQKARTQIEELTLANDEHDRFFTLSLDLLCIADFEGYFKRINPAWTRILGYTEKELLGKPFVEFVHPDDVEKTLQESSQIATGKDTVSFENRYRCKDGSYKWLSWNSGGDIEQQLIYAVARDISDSKALEATLRESEHRYESLVSASPVAIFRTDAEGICSYVNPRCCELVGLSPEDRLDEIWVNAVHPNDRERVFAEWRESINHQRLFQSEYRCLHSDGSVVWVFGQVVAQTDENGEVVGYIGTNTDITDRKQVEAEASRFVSILEGTPDFVGIATAEGKTIYVNKAGRQMLGVNEDYDIGQHTYPELCAESALECIFEGVNQAIEKGLWQGETALINLVDGTEIPVSQVIMAHKSPSGEVEYISTVARDISESKRNAAELAHSEAELRKQTIILQRVLDSMKDGVIVADETGKFILFNRSAEEMYGLGVSDSPPQEWSETYGLFLPDAETPFPTEEIPLMKTIQGEEMNEVEMFTRHPGQPEGLWVKVNGRPLLNEQGVVEGGVAVSRNVTQEKETQERLTQLAQEQERLLQELKNRQDVLNEVAIVSETDRRGLITYVNDRFCEISGYSREELIGKNHRIINAGYHSKEFFEDLWRTISRGQIWKGEVKNRAKDGSFYWVDSAIAPLFNEKGKIAKYIGIRFDITEQKNVAERLTQIAEERQAETDALTEQVVRLLGEIKGAAKGDLTVKAKVTNDILGSLADSFNYLIGSLRKVVINIQDSAAKVNQATTDSIGNTRELAEQARIQASQIEANLKQLERMLFSIKDVSDAAQRAEQVSQEAQSTAESGGKAVDRTVEGINDLRQTIAETSKMMKRLGEGSQQIGKIVTSISQIASQTNLLALNATIEAARAGEQGQGFAVVADEVRKLAERSASATQEISEIVKMIQDDISRVTGAMESGTQQVVEGTKIAAEAKTNLVAIIEVSREINGLVQNITRASQKQTISAEDIAESMKQVNEISTATASKAENMTVSLDDLAIVVNQLQGSVKNFRS